MKVSCPEACDLRLALLLERKRARRLGLTGAKPDVVVGSAAGRLSSPGTTRVVVKLTAKAKRRLRRAREVILTLKTEATDHAGNSATTGRIKARR